MLHDPNQNTLFPKLSEAALQELQQHGIEVQLNQGEVLFKEGDANYNFYIVLEGEVQVSKQVNSETRLLAVHHRGDFMGEISMLTGTGSIATAQAIAPSRVLQINLDTFKHIIADGSPIADTILMAMVGRSKDVEAQLRQQEKLAGLGKMSAGLAHELNNPAAAAGRAAGQMRETLPNLQSLSLQLNTLSPEQIKFLQDIQRQATDYATQAPLLDTISQSDKEDEVIDWLEDNDVQDGWKVASTLVGAGIDTVKLDSIALQIPTDALPQVLTWLESTLTVAGLITEIEQSTTRISELVKAIKGYCYMDRAAMQKIDVHEGIENTLVILNHRLKKGVTVKREYDRTLPRICAYGSELNQVWTNLIDNAIDAMDGKGVLTIRTSKENDCIAVEIADTGTGIPPAIQSRIFEPFFTTKGVGQGTGLGLEITYRIVKGHKGDIHVESEPGNTRFLVELPIQSRLAQ